MTVAVLIVAAGRGQRLGAAIPKQYLPIAGPCSLRRSIETFLAEKRVTYLRAVIHPDDESLYCAALAGLEDPRVLAPVGGGTTRAYSVRFGLESLRGTGVDRVLIHDAARPFVTARVIAEVIGALDGAEGASAALPLVDALWRESGGFADVTVPREGLWRAQTPQGFHFDSILSAHLAHDGSGADDVAVAREAGLSVKLVLGSENNYKITTAADLERALDDARRVG